jgi:Phage derived protein Gp49-like (DUF891)
MSAGVAFNLGSGELRRTKGCQRPRVLTGSGDPSVLEVIESHASHAYRAMYTVRFAAALSVLHVFHKQSKSAIETPRPDMDLAHAFAIRTDYALTYRNCTVRMVHTLISGAPFVTDPEDRNGWELADHLELELDRIVKSAHVREWRHLCK